MKILSSSFNQEALINFYSSLPYLGSLGLQKLAQNLASVFGSTSCEQVFSWMKQN
jgi:hypothetical protein